MKQYMVGQRTFSEKSGWVKPYYMVAQRPFGGKSGGLWDIGWMTYKTDAELRDIALFPLIGIKFRYW